jgi:hypothetical protein
MVLGGAREEVMSDEKKTRVETLEYAARCLATPPVDDPHSWLDLDEPTVLACVHRLLVMAKEEEES